ncbi:MAG: hypothetical protein JF570_08510, partial [Caulobacter sp.]|nr:hypothetical protein [Caulobacter sp.]
MLKFGGRNGTLFGHTYSGNLGVRYVETTVESKGSTAFPVTLNASQLLCEPRGAPLPGQPTPEITQTIGCYISAEDRAFNSGATTPSTISTKHENWLPSFNF